MVKFFEEHETLFSIILIVIYVVVNSFCMQNFGYTSIYSLIINTLYSMLLLFLIIKLKRVEYYGLVNISNSKMFLYFVPLVLISLVNIITGINVTENFSKIIIHILVMINIGFIEEIIFRGFLFKMMAKDNIKSAIIVSSISFGIGHIVNLLNGADFLPTLMQILCACLIGYLFVIIFIKSKSIIPCILTHIVINCTSIFSVEYNVYNYIILIFITVFYSIYINKNIKE